MTYDRTLTAELLATINGMHEALYHGGSRPTPLKAATALNCLANQLRAADYEHTKLIIKHAALTADLSAAKTEIARLTDILKMPLDDDHGCFAN